MNKLVLWSLILTIPPAIAALIVLGERARKPISRLIRWQKAINQPAPVLETVAEPDQPEAVASTPRRRRQQSHYNTICELDSRRNWNGRLPPLYPDAVASGPYAQRQLANHRNGTRTR